MLLDPDPHYKNVIESRTAKSMGVRIHSNADLDLPTIFKLSVVDPDPHPDPHQFADNKPKCTKYEPIWALFQGLEPLFCSLDRDPDPRQRNADPQNCLKVPMQKKLKIFIKKVILTGCESATSYWIWAWSETLIWSGTLTSCGGACPPRPPPTLAPGGPAPACPASRRLPHLPGWGRLPLLPGPGRHPLLPGPGRLADAYRPSSRRGRLARAGDDLDLWRF